MKRIAAYLASAALGTRDHGAASGKIPTGRYRWPCTRSRATDLSNALQPPNSSGLLPQSTHCYVGRPVDLLARRRAEGSPRDLRGFGSCERQFRRREPTEPKPMSTLSIEKSRNPKSAAPKKGSAKSNATSRRKITSAALKVDEPKV